MFILSHAARDSALRWSGEKVPSLLHERNRVAEKEKNKLHELQARD